MLRLRPIVSLLAFGFFPIFAQALLFRDFLSTFAGHEFAIGCFYSSWLFGLALGGGLARPTGTSFPVLLLLYIPVFLLQQFALLHVRAWAGLGSYELFPLGPVAAWSFVVNIPLSLLTGWLFPRACRDHASAELPLARVYVWESLGACAGGALATALLAVGQAPAWCAALGFAVAAAPFLMSPARTLPRTAAALAVLAALLGGDAWQQHSDQQQWRRVLPGAAMQGHFTTQQGRYLFGEYGAQLNVVAGETVLESFPEAEHAATVAALFRAQQPEAQRVLLIGPGLAIADAFPGPVDWIHPDREFARRLLETRAVTLRGRPGLPEGEPRAFLAAATTHYDVILINLPSASTLALNRFLTREGLAAAQSALASNGVLGVCARGGENYLGPELALLGASLYHSLTGLFPHVILKPGDETWFMASARPDLTSDREELARRYRTLPAAAQTLPPEALAAQWPPDRIAAQLARYRQVLRAADPALLLNTDAHPRALLQALLLAARETGAGSRWAWFVRGFTAKGRWITLAAIALGALLWLGFARRGAPGSGTPLLLIATTGAAGMAVSVLLMCLFQSRFGSLAVHSGLLSALFMLGLAAGGRLRVRLLPLLALHMVFLAALAVLPPPVRVASFAIWMLAAGLLTGAYVPIAVRGLRGRADAEGARGFIAMDNLAGAAAGLLVGLLFMPALGPSASAALLIPLLALNFLGLLRPAPAAHDPFRAAGFAGLGAAALVLLASHLLHAADPRSGRHSFDGAARMLGTTAKLALGTKDAAGAWAALDEDGRPSGRVFDTSKLAPGSQGYGGPLSLAVLVSTNRTLLGAQVLESHETPSYQARVERWLDRLARGGTDRSALERVDGVAGATLTSDAVLAILRGSLDRLAGVAPALPPSRWDPAPVVLVGLLAWALVVHLRPGRWRRRVLLLATLSTAGLWLNAQYSLDHLFALLGLHLPTPAFNIPFLLVVGVPVLVLFFGNLYCGYLCPFGALQELLGEWTARFSPGKEAWRWARALKFAVLAAAVLWFSIDLARARAELDPLVSVFSAGLWRRPPALVLLAVAGAVFFRRFWCRNLCPTGAFLSLLGAIRPLRRWLPAVQPSLCDLGVRTARDADCLHCGRCRMRGACAPAPARSPWPGLFAAAVILGAVLLAANARHIGARLAPPASSAAEVTEDGFTRGQPANVPALRALIQQGKLSGREAMHYREYQPEP